MFYMQNSDFLTMKLMRLFFPTNSQLVTGRLCRAAPKICPNVAVIPLACRTYAVKSYKARENTLVRNYENSFQIWVLNFFKNDPRYSSFDVQKSDVLHSDPDSDFESILNCLWTKKAQEALTPLLLRKIDAALNEKISPKTPATDLVKCLQICTTSVPIQAGKMESFRNAIIQLENRIKKSQLTTHDVVQVMYYASHLKSGVLAKRFMQAALYHLDVSKLENLNTTDLGIYCVSLFRCAVPVAKADILKFLDERFRAEISSLISEQSAIFVSFVKCFRLSKYYGGELLGFVAGQGLAKLSELDVTARIHLAVWFAAGEYGDVDFVGHFLSSCVRDLSLMISDNAGPRLKDCDNLLWSSASYGLPEVNVEIRSGSIPEYVRDRLCLARNDPHLQISLLTWLWMCGCRLEREVAQSISPETVKYIKDSKNFKSVANLFLLMTCAELEAPGLLKPNILNSRDYRLQPKVPKYLEKRPRLKELLTTLQKHSELLQLDNLRFAFQIPAPYIGGIYAEHQGRPLCIEVLDSAVCLSNVRHLKGRMTLKLRLLEKMGLPVLKVEVSDSPTATKRDTIADLKQFLKQLLTS